MPTELPGSTGSKYTVILLCVESVAVTTLLLSRREVRASGRLYAGGGSCLRDLWRAWRIRETAEVRDVRKMCGGRGLCGGPGKIMGGVFPRRPQSFRHQRRPVDDCSPGRGGMAQNGGSRGGTFHGEMDRCRGSQGWTIRHAVVCPNVTRRTNKERIAQSKRARAGSLALVD